MQAARTVQAPWKRQAARAEGRPALPVLAGALAAPIHPFLQAALPGAGEEVSTAATPAAPRPLRAPFHFLPTLDSFPSRPGILRAAGSRERRFVKTLMRCLGT